MSGRGPVVALLGLALCVALPDTASACAVCFSGPDQTRGAFIATTIGMSVLPLAMIGGVIWWLRRQVKASQRAAAERSADAIRAA